MVTYNENQIKEMLTVRLKIIVQPFFYACMTATEVLARRELFRRRKYEQTDARLF